ncbi:hypothetical protein P7C70_g1208, partial [Phenoliferia sp. Uapishka_3]
MSPPSARARTASPYQPTIAEGEERQSEVQDDDPGLFSFLPPPNPTSPPASSTQRRSDTTCVPSTPPQSPTNRHAELKPSPPPHTVIPSTRPLLQTPISNDGLSPAAAYARAAQRHLGGDGGWVVGATTRKRGSWNYPGSPTHTVGDSCIDRSTKEYRPRAGTVGSEETRGSKSTDGAGFGRTWSTSEENESMFDTEMRDLAKKANTPHVGSQVYDSAGQLKFGERRRSGGQTEATIEMSYFDGVDEDSPFPEVRASVSNYDDPEMPSLTFRSIFIGLAFTLVVGAANVFFSFRYPAPTITASGAIPIFVSANFRDPYDLNSSSLADNRVVNQLFGVSSGLGMSLLTFDWTQISYVTSPLVAPFWSQVCEIPSYRREPSHRPFAPRQVIPGTFVYAIALNLMVELIGGYLLPGDAVANMLFKVYGLQPQVTAMTFVQDLKLGHYMKIPPRVTVSLPRRSIVPVSYSYSPFCTVYWCALDGSFSLERAQLIVASSHTFSSLLFIFFTLQLPRGGTIAVNWWGNTVFENTDDWNGVAYLTPPESGFGPDTWT